MLMDDSECFDLDFPPHFFPEIIFKAARGVAPEVLLL